MFFIADMDPNIDGESTKDSPSSTVSNILQQTTWFQRSPKNGTVLTRTKDECSQSSIRKSFQSTLPSVVSIKHSDVLVLIPVLKWLVYLLSKTLIAKMLFRNP